MKYEIDFVVKHIATYLNIKDVTNLEDIQKFFEWLKGGYDQDKIDASLLAVYLYNNIAQESVRKRKVSARDFEDYLAAIFSGVVTDEDTRSNRIVEINGQPSEVQEFIASNRREKVDVIFPNGYGLTVKTSVPDNMEINMGSFERSALFNGFLEIEEYGGERKKGLGSRPQMINTFKKIWDKGQWKEFNQRFQVMVNNIFADDMIFTIKGGNYFQIFFVKNETLRDTLVYDLQEGHTNLKVINRYEGNSIRIDRKLILDKSTNVKIDFSDIKNNSTYNFLTKLDEYNAHILQNYLDGKITTI